VNVDVGGGGGVVVVVVVEKEEALVICADTSDDPVLEAAHQNQTCAVPDLPVSHPLLLMTQSCPLRVECSSFVGAAVIV
jgi:hypothetical protein